MSSLKEKLSGKARGKKKKRKKDVGGAVFSVGNRLW
jgi:hypothetical protein